MKPSITVRPIDEDDWTMWRALRLSALCKAPEAFGGRLADWQGEGDTEQRWRNRLRDIRFNVIAELDGTPAGMVSGLEPGELLSLWVEPFARGHGVGDLLIRTVFDWAAQRGQPVTLRVMHGNAPAIALYRRHGFIETTAPAPPGEQSMARG